MTDNTGNLPPAGWYPDPYGAPLERWWDGAQWTDHTNTPAPPTPAPVSEAPAQPVYEAPAQPAYEAPAAETPAFETPTFEAPTFQTPTFETPTFQTPSFETPEYPAPASAEPQQPASWSISDEAQEPQPFGERPASGQPNAAPALEEPAGRWDNAEPLSFENLTFTQPGYSPSTPVADRGPIRETPAFEAPVYGAQDVAAQDYAAQAYAVPALSTPQPAAQAPVTIPVPAGPDATFDFGQLVSGEGATTGDSWSNEDYIEEPTNPAATAGLAFGVLSFILVGIGSLLGLVFSVIGLLRSGSLAGSDGVAVGRGKAIAGLVLSVIGGAVSVSLVLWGLQTFVNPDSTSQSGEGQTVETSGLAAYQQTSITEFGNIALALGESSLISTAATGEPAIQFTVTGITPLAECTTDDGSVLTPENGQFLALAFELTTSADYLGIMTSGVPLRVSMSDWQGHLADGSVIANSDTASSCVGETELPDEIAAGSTVSGIVFVDTATGSSGVSYSPANVDGIDPTTTRWEWPTA